MGELLDRLAGREPLDGLESPSQAQIDKRAEQLVGEMRGKTQEGLVTVVCPECGHDFEISGANVPAGAG